MRLKSLELTGFKSFAEAKIEFPEGITSVVGPNGTGKSNVVDAILWVLGEQSAKTLRSERMEDVIFNGTELRKPLGMAEVSLIMSGVADERLSGLGEFAKPLGEFHEVMVTRRLYRNGDSEYLLNKTPCRLKDVRSLFLDTRAGTKGHTIIEQGRIDQILNASPQDRRELIEETAGIVRYKKQKAEALRKLESTQQNLLRVRDIVAEVRRQLNSLDRQARQARSYQTLRDEAKVLEIRLLARDARALIAGQAAVETELADLESQESGRMAEQARLSREAEECRLVLLSSGEALERLRADVARLEQEQAQALTAAEVEKGRLALFEQQQTQSADERSRLSRERVHAVDVLAQLHRRLEELREQGRQRSADLGELERAAQTLAETRRQAFDAEEQARRDIIGTTVEVTSGENTLASLTSRDDEASRRIARLAREWEEISGRHAEALQRLQALASVREDGERRLQQLRDEAVALTETGRQLDAQVQEADQTIARQQEELAAAQSQVQALQSVLREDMGYGREGEEAASLRSRCAGVRDSMAEWLTVSKGYECAIEAALGGRVRAWLVDSTLSGREAIAFMKENGLGRGAFVPMGLRCGVAPHEAWWPALQGKPGVRGRAMEFVRAGESSELASWLLAGIVIVDNLETAVALWEQGGWTASEGPILVTLDGDMLDPAGVMSGGTNGPASGMLQRRSEIQRLEGERSRLVEAVQASREARDRITAERDEVRRRLQGLEGEVRDAEMQALGWAKDEAAYRHAADDLARRRETIETERRSDDDEQGQIRQEMESLRARLAQRRDEKIVKESALSGLQAGLRAMEEETRTLHQRMSDARLAVESLRGQLEHGDADHARLSREQEQRDGRIATLEQQTVALEEAIRTSRDAQERNAALVGELQGRIVGARESLTGAQEGYQTELERSRTLDRDLAAVREALSSCLQARTVVEVRRAEIRTQLTALEGTLTGTYQLAVAEVLAQEEAREAETERQLLPDEGSSTDPSDEIRAQLQKIKDRLERLGPINLASIEEHRELEERHKFLTTQEEDLSRSVAGLKEIISRINRTTKQLFMDTFNELQQKFGEVFVRFFPGGRAELVLVEPVPDPETGEMKSDEPGVDVVAQPPGKRLKNLSMLSGGEKTLTAMALIFASFLIRPTPFCILDEIDAPLDEENIGRFTTVLRDLSADAQFIVITHNKRTMAIADSLFGVTMEEPGVSKMVTVRLADLQPA